MKHNNIFAAQKNVKRGFKASSSPFVRFGVLARFVATDGGITRVYPKRCVWLDQGAWEGVDNVWDFPDKK